MNEDLWASVPVAQPPIYETPRPNEPITLWEGQGSLDADSTYAGWCRLTLDWLPSPRLICELQLQTGGLPPSDWSSCSLSLDGLQVEGPAVAVQFPLLPLGGSNLKLWLKKVERGQATGLTHLVFHLPNFPDYVGYPIRDDQTSKGWSGRLTLDVDAWRIRLDSVPNLGGNAGLREALAGTTGYAITHVGLLERAHAGHFSVDDVRDILDGLGVFLSFARGAWSRPILLVGFAGDETAWESWDIPWMHSYRAVQSWMPETEPVRLVDAWRGFVRLWKDPDWRRPLSTAVQWYLDANTQVSLETTVVLCQIALELLAAQIIVGSKPPGEQASFDKKTARARLRKLLGWCGIPPQIPDELSHLQTRGRKTIDSEGWEDGPHAITQLRRWLVHPKAEHLSKSLSEDPKVWWEVRCLGLWYLEMVLLRLMDYDGPYQSRLRAGGWRGDHDLVPWGIPT